jgi:hypothetical protein
MVSTEYTSANPNQAQFYATTILAIITLLINVCFFMHIQVSPDPGPTFSPAQSGSSTPNPGFNYSKKQDIKIQPQRPGNKSHENNGYTIDPFA